MQDTTPKYKIGDLVEYTNDNGVCWGTKEIVGIEKVSYSDSGFGYYIKPTDTSWFAVKEENLRPINQ
jgi:hypothetical protein